MNMRAIAVVACVAGGAISAAQAEPPRETVVSSQKLPIPNIAGKTLVASLIEYQPGGRTPSHRHPGANLVYAHVISGAIRSRLQDDPPRIYTTGESWFELPGAHHKISENASDTEPARLLVIFVVDADSKTLVVPDPG